MGKPLYVDKECRIAVKKMLGERLWRIYERKQQDAEGGDKKRLTYSSLAEKCFCEARTIERMVHAWDPQLPLIFNVWLFYEALDVSEEEQLSIQKEITDFICSYMKEDDD